MTITSSALVVIAGILILYLLQADSGRLGRTWATLTRPPTTERGGLWW